MAQLTLVVGGVRSGKSRWAEELAARAGPVTYLAVAQAGDAEMAARIARHQERRAGLVPPWTTVEEPWDAVARLRGTVGSVLVECVPLWLTNHLLGMPPRPAEDDATIRAEVAALAQEAQATAARVIIVTSETGFGIVPDNPLARRFGDLLGEANQLLAAAAAEVYVCVVGIPLRIK